MNYFTGKNILIISPEPWGISKVSKHHYAETLARLGNRVWFLEPPGRSHHKIQAPAGINLMSDTFSFRGLRFLPRFVRTMLLKRSAQKIEKAAGIFFDVIWSFDNSRHYNLTSFSAGVRIHFVADIGMNLHLAEASETSTISLSPAPSIVNELKKFQRNSYFIHHGFAPSNAAVGKLPGRNNHIKAAYAGNLLIPFLNWSLIERLVRENPDVDFIFIGPEGKSNMSRRVSPYFRENLEHLKKNNNVFLTGEKSPAETQALMEQSDILLMLYDHERFPQEVENSHKMMMYLATGKTILSHPIPVYAYPHLVETAVNENEFIAKFRSIVSNTGDFNRIENMMARKTFANDHNYDRQLLRIEELILRS